MMSSFLTFKLILRLSLPTHSSISVFLPSLCNLFNLYASYNYQDGNLSIVVILVTPFAILSSRLLPRRLMPYPYFSYSISILLSWISYSTLFYHFEASRLASVLWLSGSTGSATKRVVTRTLRTKWPGSSSSESFIDSTSRKRLPFGHSTGHFRHSKYS